MLRSKDVKTVKHLGSFLVLIHRCYPDAWKTIVLDRQRAKKDIIEHDESFIAIPLLPYNAELRI